MIAYIINSMNTRVNEEKLMETFKEFDKNNDGTLSMDELREGFKEFMGPVGGVEMWGCFS